MWKAVYDSVPGTSHKDTGLPCQDACRVVQLNVNDGTLLVVCSADGAGSASHAALGSEIACDTFICIVKRECEGKDIFETAGRERIVDWCRELRSQIKNRALEVDVEIRQLASTFLAAIVGESKALFIQIGDGAMVILDSETYRPVFWPQSGEFANTTNFLTDDQFEKRLDWARLEQRVDELATFSDGLERLILRFADRTVHSQFLVPMFVALRQAANPEEYFDPLRKFLDSPKVNERTDDDKTLILATRLIQCSH